MRSQKGLPLDPTSGGYAWVASVVRAVETRTGVPSQWNGELYEELNPRIAVRAREDGSMTVNRETVLDPVRDAYVDARGLGWMTDGDLRRVREATLATTREAAHHCTALDDPAAPDGDPVGDEADQGFHAGLTELWARANVHGVMSDIGMDHAVPGVIGPISDPELASFTTAATVMVRRLGAMTNVEPDDILNHLQSTPRAHRWNAAADVVINHRLTGLVPPAHRQEVRSRLAGPVRDAFAELTERHSNSPARGRTMTKLGNSLGQDAMDRMTGISNRLAAHYRGQVDKLQGFLAGQGPASAATGRPAAAADPTRPRPSGATRNSAAEQGRG